MHRVTRTISLLGVGILLAGCGRTLNSLESQARVDPRTIAAYPGAGETTSPKGSCDARLRGDSHDIAINLDCFRFPYTEADGLLAYQMAEASKADRNRLGSILIKHSDDVCIKEMGDMSAREAISNTVLGITTSALSTVSSIVTGEKLKSWLAGGAGFSNASRDHINSEVFRNVLASAMAKAIQNARDVQRKDLLQNFASTTREDYSVDQMIMDVNRYHQICSFYNGLVLVVDAVNRASPTIAGEYRNLSAAISDLNMAIADYDRQIANEKDLTLKAAMEAERAALRSERTKKIIERASLGSTAPVSAADEEPANPDANPPVEPPVE